MFPSHDQGGKLGGQFSDRDFDRTVEAVAGGDFSGMARLFGNPEAFKKALRLAQQDISLVANSSVQPFGGNWEPIINEDYQLRSKAAIGKGLEDTSGGPTEGDLITQAKTANNIKDVNDAGFEMLKRLDKNEAPVQQVEAMIKVLRGRKAGDVTAYYTAEGNLADTISKETGQGKSINLADELQKKLDKRLEQQKLLGS